MTVTIKREMSRDMGPLALRADVSPSSIDVEKRTFDIVWTTGARVQRGFFDPYVEELSLDPAHVRMDRLNSGATPFLDDHLQATSCTIGVVESARLEGDKGTATVRFTAAGVDPNADMIFGKIADGILRNISVGYRVYRMELIESSDTEAPVYRVTDWEPVEISVVPVGADAGAHVRGATARETTNPCVFVQRKGTPMEDKEVTPAPVAETRAVEASNDLVRAQAAKQERARSAEIKRFARAFGVDETFTEKHIEDGTSVEQFRALATDLVERSSAPKAGGDAGRRGVAVVELGESEKDKFARGASDWLIQRAAVDDLVKEHAKKKGEAVKLDGGEFRGMTLVDLARRSLELNGVKTAGMDTMRMIGMALTHRSSYSGIGDFPVVLENTMNKVLLAAYATTPDTWRRFCAVGSANDFRAQNRYKLGSFGSLDTVNENGEFKRVSIPDGSKEQISVATKGNIIGLSRQSIINDDMGAFNRLPMMYGRAAAISIEKAVFARLAENSGLGPTMNDGKAMFHADHSNIGTASALTVAGIEADRVLMGQQMDPSSNEYLELRPAILLLPIGLGGAARVINQAQYDVDPVTTNATNKFQVPNKVLGLYSDIVDTARLSGTRRYSFASPAIAPTFEVAFLNGQQTPYTETKNGWDVDGVEWKVRLDFGVGAVDFRSAVTNAGQ